MIKIASALLSVVFLSCLIFRGLDDTYRRSWGTVTVVDKPGDGQQNHVLVETIDFGGTALSGLPVSIHNTSGGSGGVTGTNGLAMIHVGEGRVDGISIRGQNLDFQFRKKFLDPQKGLKFVVKLR